MSWIEALILGLIQGLSEFLPISSSGHLELGSVLFGLQDPDGFFTFNIMVHGATFLSVLVVFRKDITQIISSCLQLTWNDETRFVVMLLISAVPVAVIGLLFEEQIESIFEGRVVFVGCMLIITGTLLFLTRYAPKQNKDFNIIRAILVGLAQTIAVLPGISRSGATIATALYLGINREKAVRFSFLMVLIPVFGANFLKILRFTHDTNAVGLDTMPLIIGTVTAFISGLFACKWMLRIVAKGQLKYFSIYCLLAGTTAIVFGIIL
jgi:undecaprenyl-diphosphatase